MFTNQYLGVGLLAFAAWVCTTSTQSAEPAQKSPTSAIVQGDNAFAVALYGKIRTENSGNLFFSPYSISTALSMTYAGAKGKTASEMAEVLHLTLPQEEIPPAFAALSAKLQGDAKKQGYKLQIANRLWGQAGYQFLPKFLQTTHEDYGAELAQVDFVQHTEVARETINTWVEEKTEKKILNLIPPGVLDQSTTLVLTNAIYFKGDWDRKFQVKATNDAPFKLTNEEKISVPMMRQKGEFPYRVVDDLQVLELPYARKDLSMFVFLPNDVSALPELEKKLTVENLASWMLKLRKQELNVYLPKFNVSLGCNMEKVLKSMGMSLAFSGNADFSGMNGKRNLFISAVIHKAFIDVNEEGTEAAAATGVVMKRYAAQKIPEFRADHPFLFLIRDNRTGSILFLGRVVNPKK